VNEKAAANYGCVRIALSTEVPVRWCYYCKLKVWTVSTSSCTKMITFWMADPGRMQYISPVAVSSKSHWPLLDTTITWLVTRFVWDSEVTNKLLQYLYKTIWCVTCVVLDSVANKLVKCLYNTTLCVIYVVLDSDVANKLVKYLYKTTLCVTYVVLDSDVANKLVKCLYKTTLWLMLFWILMWQTN
jgi:hypothetical protein